MRGKWVPLVRVFWRDACSHGWWGDKDAHADDDLDTVETVGFLLGQNKKTVRVAQSASGRGNLHNVMVIPAVSVGKMVYLTQQKKPRRR